MKFPEIKNKIVNNQGFNSFKEIKQAGYRLVKERDGNRYFLAQPKELKPLLVKLGDIAEVTAGIITGDNAKYYQKRPSDYDKNKYSLVFKSPREVSKILLTSEDAMSIIKIKNIPFEIRKAPLLWVDIRRERHICHINYDMLPFEHNFYGIYPKGDNQLFKLSICFNCAIMFLFIETFGIGYGGGGGPIRIVARDIKNLLVVNPNRFYLEDELKFNKLFNRHIKSIFEELGFNPRLPIRDQEPNPLPDRKELDDIIFDILGLTKEERKEVYWAVCELVKNRLEKAKSV